MHSAVIIVVTTLLIVGLSDIVSARHKRSTLQSATRISDGFISQLLLLKTLQRMWSIAAGDTKTPMERSLIAESAALAGLPQLYWQALFAGFGDHTLLWLRFRQFKLVVAVVICGSVLVLGMTLPLVFIAVPLAVSVPLSYVLLRVELASRAATRRRRLSVLAVPFLYNLSNLVSTGLSIKDAMRDMANPRGNDIERELTVVVRLISTGVPLERALRVFACRCHSPHLNVAVNRMISAQDSRSVKRTLSAALADVANATFIAVTSEMRRRKAQTIVRTLGMVVVTALPTWIFAALAPVSFSFYRTFHGS